MPRRRAEGVVRRARVRDRRHRGGVRGGALRAGGARGRERADGARAERSHRKSAQLRGRPLVRIRARRGTRRRRGVRASAEYAEDDPDGALRRAICPRNPTADICRSQRDRKRQNDSPCKVPLLNACLVWKEGASRDVVLKR